MSCMRPCASTPLAGTSRRFLGTSTSPVPRCASGLPNPAVIPYGARGTLRAKRAPLTVTAPAREYAYLLGQYLGDGCLSEMGPRGVFRLRIATCDAYPRIRERCAVAIRTVLPDRKVGLTPSIGCSELFAYSKHWPCLFPQHGSGRKHDRTIGLVDWQQAIVEVETRDFLAGLIHSDGCRAVNKVVTRGKTYSYPRYFFSNVSEDILMLCADAFDQLGVEWRQNNWNSLSVAKRDSVAFLDTFIGPKA